VRCDGDDDDDDDDDGNDGVGNQSSSSSQQQEVSQCIVQIVPNWASCTSSSSSWFIHLYNDSELQIMFNIM
jgi:hypothetical protein